MDELKKKFIWLIVSRPVFFVIVFCGVCLGFIILLGSKNQFFNLYLWALAGVIAGLLIANSEIKKIRYSS